MPSRWCVARFLFSGRKTPSLRSLRGEGLAVWPSLCLRTFQAPPAVLSIGSSLCPDNPPRPLPPLPLPPCHLRPHLPSGELGTVLLPHHTSDTGCGSERRTREKQAPPNGSTLVHRHAPDSSKAWRGRTPPTALSRRKVRHSHQRLGTGR